MATKICNYQKKKTEPIDVTDTLDKSEKKENNRYYSENKCDLCDYPRPSGTKHIHFMKGKKIMEDNTKHNRSNYPPIESVFSKIDKMAEDNSNSAKLKRIGITPGKPILQTSSYRMSNGDLNYLGSNKAIFYFDRGIRGKQIFNNSMYLLELQPKYKDLVVIDDIVFTSSCKCDSDNQHKEMFPHYTATCAVGLTCPARLNNIEKILYARDARNASSEKFTSARLMLVRYW